ncbi:AAA family ATPase [bacterium]|nr:AAA family ATPase [bacterium]
MRIEHIRLKNFKTSKDVEIRDIPRMCVFVGANGTGKTTLFDAFGFLRDCLEHNVCQAWMRRGGMNEVRSRDATGPLEIELKFREPDGPLVTYLLQIDLDVERRPIVSRELLRYKHGSYGALRHVLDFPNGAGMAITNESAFYEKGENLEREEQRLESPDILAIKGLGQFEKFRKASAFRRLIENRHVSDFHIADARPSQEAGYAEHLSVHGDNLPLVAQYMYESHPDAFQLVLEKMRQRVPGVRDVIADQTSDGRIVLKFQDGAFEDPFVARFVSDGTIMMIACLLLLYDPTPHPLLCVEEPENQLHPQLLIESAEEFREYAERGGQVFISTHSPAFLNSVELDELLWLEKTNGFTSIHRAKDDPNLEGLVEEGDLLGYRWKQECFGGIPTP